MMMFVSGFDIVMPALLGLAMPLGLLESLLVKMVWGSLRPLKRELFFLVMVQWPYLMRLIVLKLR